MTSELRRLFVGSLLLACFVAVFRYQELAGDPGIYRSRMALLFDGNLPYVDFFFEHLPFTILPMGVAWLLGGAFGDVAYTVIFALLMAVCLWITAVLVERLGERLSHERAGFRWLAVAAPLFPFILFRSDPFPVVFASAALLALVEGRERRALWMECAGILAKGWPVVLAVPEWWRGRRLRATVLVVTAAGLIVGLVALPGFSQARQFEGIHSETLFGAAFTLARFRSGSSLELISDAGATYVAVPSWVVPISLTVGIILFGIALTRLRSGFSWNASVRLVAATLVALMVASPLLSPQFMLWPTPFLALHHNRKVRGTAIAVSALTLIYMLGWNPGFEGDLWWVGVVNLRNLVLLVLGALTAWTVSGSQTSMGHDQPAGQDPR
jgi:hypothetical protein